MGDKDCEPAGGVAPIRLVDIRTRDAKLWNESVAVPSAAARDLTLWLDANDNEPGGTVVGCSECVHFDAYHPKRQQSIKERGGVERGLCKANPPVVLPDGRSTYPESDGWGCRLLERNWDEGVILVALLDRVGDGF